MKYIIKVTETCPEGAVTGIIYHLCETETEMERMVNAFRDGHDYTTVTCLGPICKPSEWMQQHVDKYTQSLARCKDATPS